MVINSKYLFHVETLYMKINLGCHKICSLVLRQNIPAGITLLQTLIRICVNNGHTNILARTRGCRKTV